VINKFNCNEKPEGKHLWFFLCENVVYEEDKKRNLFCG